MGVVEIIVRVEWELLVTNRVGLGQNGAVALRSVQIPLIPVCHILARQRRCTSMVYLFDSERNTIDFGNGIGIWKPIVGSAAADCRPCAKIG
jgi:hypothetical protein